jgi:hypothetical protein
MKYSRVPALFLLLLSVLSALPAFAQDGAQTPPPDSSEGKIILAPPVRKNTFGLQLGTYTPGNLAVKSKFGDSWSGVGLGFGPIYAPQVTRKVNSDITVISTKRKFTAATLIPIGISYRQSLTPLNMEKLGEGIWPTSGTYVGGSLNIVAGQLRSNLAGDNFANGWKTTTGASVYVGHVFSEKLSVEARYYGMGKLQGFDFSGTSISAGFRF